MIHKKLTRQLPLALIAGISVVVAGCGGSDGGEASSSPAPAPAPAPTPPPAQDSMPGNSNEATYQVTFTAQWTNANGFGAVPGSAHFSSVIGSPVNEQSSLWQTGQASSVGMEAVAENGTTASFSSEIAAEVAANAASGVVNMGGTLADNSVSAEVTFTRVFPLFTFASMVAPSPDWFVGQSKYSMLDSNSEWASDVQINLRVYDAGTEDGDTFSGSNPESNPLGVIERLNGLVAGELNFVDGLVNGNAIARIQLTRIR